MRSDALCAVRLAMMCFAFVMAHQHHTPGSGKSFSTLSPPRQVTTTIALAGLEILLFLIPVSIVPYLPSFFFGSLLMLFGIEISLSWLVLSYKKVLVFCSASTAACCPHDSHHI